MTGGLVVEDAFRCEEETHLTVMKTSLFFPGDGFAVYDSKGQLAFRVDSYGPDARDTGEVVLMDPHGRCLLTVRRKVNTNFSFRGSAIDSRPSGYVSPVEPNRIGF